MYTPCTHFNKGMAWTKFENGGGGVVSIAEGERGGSV